MIVGGFDALRAPNALEWYVRVGGHSRDMGSETGFAPRAIPPNSAMLEVLFCPELLGLICQNCDRHTLSQLSLTNRTISCSALEELWSSIENFGPLIRCMPADLWEECISKPMPKTRSLVRWIHNSLI